jgi:hypothetical protein
MCKIRRRRCKIQNSSLCSFGWQEGSCSVLGMVTWQRGNKKWEVK